jgi:Arabinose efflux permease
LKNRSTILILGTAQFIMVLDTTVMNVSISQVVADLDTTVSSLQLAITAYTLVMAAFMLTGAKLGDMFGRRRIFSIGLGVYGAGSLITALSPNIGVLLFGWSFTEGLGACMVIPAIAALTATNYTGKERALAFAMLGGIAGAGVAAGPLIGGFVTSALSWRVVFASETVVVTAILLFGVRRIEDTSSASHESLDKTGAALSALGLGLVVFGILKSSEWGLVTPTGALTIGGTQITPFGLSVVPFIVVAGVCVLLAFRRWEQREVRLGRQPLLRPDLMKISQLRSGLSMFVSSYLIMAGTFFVLPLYLQLVLGKDAFETGVAIMPISIAMILAAVAGGRLADRISPRRIVEVGLVVLFLGLIGLFASISPQLTSPVFSISLAFFGAGIGLVVSQLGNVTMSAVDESRSNEVGGLQGAGQSLGSSLGTALIGAILLAGLTTDFHDQINSDDNIPAKVQKQIVNGTEQGVPMVSKPTVEQTVKKAGLPPNQAQSVVDAYSSAQIDALKRALLAASVFALVALWLAGDLPRVPLGEADADASPSQPPSAEPLPET